MDSAPSALQMPCNHCATAQGGELRSTGWPTCPINSLPPELLVEILTYADPGTRVRVGWKLGLPYRLVMMAVCRHWRSVIIDNARFWRIIEVYRHLDWLALSLERSRTSPIHVRFHMEGPDFAQTMHALAAHTGRIVELTHPHLRVDQPQTLAMTQGLMSMLRSLNLGIRPRRVQLGTLTLPTLTIPDKDLPTLQRLSLFGMAIAAPTSVLSRLRVLKLAGWNYFAVDVDTTRFLAMLSACTSLECLTLVHTYGRLRYDSIPEGAGPVVTLPRIREVGLMDTYQSISHLLSHIILPTNVDLRLAVDQTLSFTGLMSAISEFLPEGECRDRLAILRALTDLRVHVAPERDGHANIIEGIVRDGAVRRGSFVLSVPASGDQLGCPASRNIVYRDIMGRLCDNFPCDATLTALFCSGDIDALGMPEDWSNNLLAHYPRLRDLVIYDTECGGSMRSLFEALTGRVPSDPVTGQGFQPLCPDLENIWVRNVSADWQTLQAIRTCLSARVAQGVPLKTLRLHLTEQEDGDEVRQVACGDVTEEEPRQLPDYDGYAAHLGGFVSSCEIKLFNRDSAVVYAKIPSLL